jgi:hypothetical protein
MPMSQYRKNKMLRARYGEPPKGYRWTDSGDLEQIPGPPARRKMARDSAEARKIWRIYDPKATERTPYTHERTYNGRFMIRPETTEEGYPVYRVYEYKFEEHGYDNPWLIKSFRYRRDATNFVQFDAPWIDSEPLSECKEVTAEIERRKRMARPKLPPNAPEAFFEPTEEEWAKYVKFD